MSEHRENENNQQGNSNFGSQEPQLSSKPTLTESEPIPDLRDKAAEKKSFTERWKTSRFLLVRGSFSVLRSVWMVVMVVAGFIAWLISMLFI